MVEYMQAGHPAVKQHSTITCGHHTHRVWPALC